MLTNLICIAIGFFFGAWLMATHPTVHTAAVNKGKEWWAKARAFFQKK